MAIEVRSTARDRLADVRLLDDFLTAGGDDRLWLEGVAADDLVRRFGSPLYVVSETALRRNVRAIRAAFAARWPAQVDALFAIKSNNNLAIRRVMASEGAGSDCFGPAELYVTLLGGADPDLVVLNGSNKSDDELAKAVELGLRVNIDAEDEIDRIDRMARARGTRARVNLRLKTVPAAYHGLGSDYFGLAQGEAAEAMRVEKWGFSTQSAAPLVREIGQRDGLILEGYHHHIGRISASPAAHAAWAEELAATIESLHDETAFWPSLLDIGGGWARERDPESGSLERNPNTVDDYAAAACAPLVALFERRGVDCPRLFIEPGRYVVGSAMALLCTVGSIKRDLGVTWVNVDASTNNLMRIDTSGQVHAIVAASGLERPMTQTVRVVGPTCSPSVLGRDVVLPDVRRGDLLAILDTGMYAETASTQFNGVPRPATVMVCGDQADLIKERETVLDVFRHHRIPERLLTGSPPAGAAMRVDP